MKLYLFDKDRWRYITPGCGEQKQLKNGARLQGTHLSYQTVILFIYCRVHVVGNIGNGESVKEPN